MSFLSTDSGTTSILLMVCLALTIVGATLCGFLTGLAVGRNRLSSHIRHIDRRLPKVAGEVTRTLQAIHDACRALAGREDRGLGLMQWRAISRQVSAIQDIAAEVTTRPRALHAPSGIQTTDRWTGLTDEQPAAERANLVENLEALIEPNDDSGVLLVVQIDRQENLQRRFGAPAIRHFTRELAAAVSGVVPLGALVSYMRPATIAVLAPEVTDGSFDQIVTALRQGIRSHNFRLPSSGREVYISASFGLTGCRVGDTPKSLMNRAIEAVQQSATNGRDEVHVHDGSRINSVAEV